MEATAEHQTATVADPIIWRDDLRAAIGVCNETIRRWIKDKRLPDPDINPTRQVMGWKRSTLHAAGFRL